MDSKRQNSGTNRREFLAATAGTLAAGLTGAFSFAPTASWAQSSRPASAPLRIIFDTDPGVDDAMAILLALRSPELKIEAITPVAGNVPLEHTLPNALSLLELAGRTDIPVAAGARTPLMRSLVTAKSVHGENGLAGVELPKPKLQPVSETASELIRRLVRANPGQITIVAVGPLTNLATAFRADPDLAGMVRGIAIMGGSLSGGNVTPAAEFNFYVDPEAARIVFEAGAPIMMVGLDVTRKALFRDEHLKVLEAVNRPVSQFAAQIMRRTMDRWSADGNHVVALHDPLTVANLIDPGILTLKDYYVTVETSGELTAGESVGYARGPVRKSAALAPEPGQLSGSDDFKPNAKVAMDVDVERFMRLLLPRITQ